jgi:hypothetical protein
MVQSVGRTSAVGACLAWLGVGLLGPGNIYIYNTYAEHRCMPSTDLDETTGLSLATPNGTNQLSLTPPNVGLLYNHPHPSARVSPATRPCLHPKPPPSWSAPRARVSPALPWRQEGVHGDRKVSIEFGGVVDSEVGQEPSIATFGGGVMDLVVASICSGMADSVVVVRQTRWQNLLAAATAWHYDLLGQSQAHAHWRRSHPCLPPWHSGLGGQGGNRRLQSYVLTIGIQVVAKFHCRL